MSREQACLTHGALSAKGHSTETASWLDETTRASSGKSAGRFAVTCA